MMTNDDPDPLSQIRDALEKLLDKLSLDHEEADLIRWVHSMFDVVPPEKVLEMMANILLRGFSGLDDRTKYLSREIEGPFRQALAMMLRSNAPLSRHVREALADNIAVDDVHHGRARSSSAFGRKASGETSALKAQSPPSLRDT
jgi:hypothetical protein